MSAEQRLSDPPAWGRAGAVGRRGAVPGPWAVPGAVPGPWAGVGPVPFMADYQSVIALA